MMPIRADVRNLRLREPCYLNRFVPAVYQFEFEFKIHFAPGESAVRSDVNSLESRVLGICIPPPSPHSAVPQSTYDVALMSFLQQLSEVFNKRSRYTRITV